jgi:predicted nucleic acid-binding protein
MTHQALIIDSGFFVALLSKSDQFHHDAIALRKKIEHKKWITTWPVLTETTHLLAFQGARQGIAGLLEMYERGGYNLFSLTKSHMPKVKLLLDKYKDLPMDLADATLVILAEELGHGDIVSTDRRDFNAYKWKNHKPFKNLFSTTES